MSANLLEAKEAPMKMQGEPENTEAVPKVSVIQPTVGLKALSCSLGTLLFDTYLGHPSCKLETFFNILIC